MNATIVSAEAKARLTEAVNNYTPPAPEKYRALNEVKESIIALRERKASYETIRIMLYENAGIEVSHQTVARYCREVLDSAKPKKPRRPKTPPTKPAAAAQGELPARSPVGQPRPREPRITPSKIFSAAAQSSPVAVTGCDHKEIRPG
jgi:hypothetical protein